MTKNFSQYTKIIERFRGQVQQPDFEAIFQDSTKNIAKTDRFLLKMEIKRLAQPCTRLIDLRGHVDGECRAFEDGSRTHYLDDLAVQVYQENARAYGGYTLGVYEAVNNTENNFRVIYQKEKAESLLTATQSSAAKPQEKLYYPAKFVPFGDFYNRQEERMNFAISVIVELADGEQFEATSSDLSVSGVKLRLASTQKLSVGDVMKLEFTGLTQEFQFGSQSVFDYQIENVSVDNNVQLIGASRIFENEKDGFKQFLKGFVQGNKRRYKINLDNTIAALKSRTLEQFSMPKMNELPVFVEAKGGKFTPRYALTCNNNQAVYQYWQNELKQSTLYNLIDSDRVERMLRAEKTGQSLLVYSFVHQSQGRSYFYTADEKQLAQDEEFTKHFLGFAASKPTFAVTMLSIFAVDIANANAPLTLAHTLSKKDAYLDMPISEEVQAILSGLSYVVVATDVTSQQIRDDYQQFSFDDIHTSKLKSFGHKRLNNMPPMDEIGVNYRNQRQEPRFVYKTPVVVEVDGVTWTGVSQDFSVSGLKVHLDKSAVLSKGEIVKIAFPNLQKITSTFELKSLPYEVMRINKNKNVLNLRVHIERHQHIGRAFFKVLIEKNKEKLTKEEYANMTPGLAKALRSIYAKTTCVPSFFIQSSGSRYKVEMLASGTTEKSFLTSLKSLSDRPNHFNLYPLLHNPESADFINLSLKNLQQTDVPVEETLYIGIKRNADSVDQAVTTKLASELTTLKLKKMFIENAQKSGKFYCIRVKLSRAAAPDMEQLNPELSYIGSYAIHRGKQLEQEIWSIAGVIQCFDISQEVIYRHKLIS